MRLFPLFSLATLLLSGYAGRAQDLVAQRRIDSLEAVLRRRPADTTAVLHHNELAFRFQQTAQPRAFRHARAALKLSQQLGFARGEGKALTILGIIHNMGGRFDSALFYHTRALTLRRRLGDRSGEAAVLNNIGLTYLYQGNYPKATAVMIQSLRLEEQGGDSIRIAEGYTNLGNVFFQLDQFAQAERYYHRYLRLAHDSLGRALAYNNLSLIASRLHQDPRAALAMACKAEGLARRLGDQHVLAQALSNIAAAYGQLHDFRTATRYQREGVALEEALGEKEAVASSLVGIGVNLANLHDPSALDYLRRGLALAHELGARPVEKNAHEGLSKAYENRGELALALRHQRLMDALKDSLLTATSSQQIQDLRTQFDLEKQEQQNRITSLQLIERDHVIRRRNWQLVALLGGLTAAVAVGWLLWNRTRLRQRLEAEQEQRHQQRERAAAVLEAEERERRRIGADLHDSVGQLLSAAKLNLSGLQHELQLREPTHELLLTNALDTLDESLREVRSLSHQLVPNALLRSGLVVAVREFVEKLAGAGPLRIELETLGLEQRLPLPVENVVYRSIQEIVANVVKHARATQVLVQLLGQPGELTVLIEDNGIGFDLAEALARPEAGIGLRNLYSRIEYLGGRLDIDARPGRGTIITLEVPLTAA
ncbi:MAG: sensor histidine kinase [Hymenobacteraceae bacterium]|nr:sensor histidine kinase [Hymenobacteraceae bacterium]